MAIEFFHLLIDVGIVRFGSLEGSVVRREDVYNKQSRLEFIMRPETNYETSDFVPDDWAGIQMVGKRELCRGIEGIGEESRVLVMIMERAFMSYVSRYHLKVRMGYH